ncbi:hypothetical protein V5G28_019230 [Scytonema sp. PRP1]
MSLTLGDARGGSRPKGDRWLNTAYVSRKMLDDYVEIIRIYLNSLRVFSIEIVFKVRAVW